jgi:hypothetical protein
MFYVLHTAYIGIPPSWDTNYVCTIYRVCVSKLIPNIRSHTGYGVSNWISNIGYVVYWASKPNIGYPISDISNVGFPNPILGIQHPILDIGYFQYPMLGIRVMYACTLCMSVHILTLSLFVMVYAFIHRHISSLSWMWIVDMGLWIFPMLGFIPNVGYPISGSESRYGEITE